MTIKKMKIYLATDIDKEADWLTDMSPAFPNCVTRVAINLDINGFSPCYKYWL